MPFRPRWRSSACANSRSRAARRRRGCAQAGARRQGAAREGLRRRVHPRRQAARHARGGVKNDIDGALLPIINFGLVRDPKVIRDTVEPDGAAEGRVGRLPARSQHLHRSRRSSNIGTSRQEFLFVDLALAELYRRLGRTTRGRRDAAADRRTSPRPTITSSPRCTWRVPCELFPGNIGDPTGAIPMVGYGAGAYVLHLLERERSREHLPQEPGRPISNGKAVTLMIACKTHLVASADRDASVGDGRCAVTATIRALFRTRR